MFRNLMYVQIIYIYFETSNTAVHLKENPMKSLLWLMKVTYTSRLCNNIVLKNIVNDPDLTHFNSPPIRKRNK